MAETAEITVSLRDIDELFDDPAEDPWDPDARYRSGIEEIMARLRTIALPHPVRVVIQLPAAAVTPDLQARTAAAIGRYCAARIEENEDEVAATRRSGRRDFFVSIGAAVALAVLIILIVSLPGIEGGLEGVIGAWAGIAFWAILWSPVETYVWGWRPNRYEARLCHKLAEAEVLIRPL